LREARSARGGSQILANARQFATLPDAVADCALVIGTSAARHREPQHPVMRLDKCAPLLRKHLLTGNVAVLFGSEKFGLSNQDLSYCQWIMRIPTQEDSPSMNLGQAVAVCLYELARNPKAPENTAAKLPQRASAADTERFTVLLLEALRASGYIKPRIAASTEQKVRRLVRRLNLPAADAETWLGILRQILWKIGSGGQAQA
jgi:TrmH family RNA methyltransferase